MDSKDVRKLADKCSERQRKDKKDMGEIMCDVAHNYIGAHPGCDISSTEIMSLIGIEFARRKKLKKERKKERVSKGGDQILLFS